MGHQQYTVPVARGAYPSDLSGLRFARLLVVARAGFTPKRQTIWRCQCDCGTTINVRRDPLLKGHSRSCGCMAREHSSDRSTKHKACQDGRSNGDRTYVSWKSMRQRCRDPNCDQYPHYGALGVTVCDRWESYAAFLADMGPRPIGMTLDRIDPFGNYEPTNCRWADARTQNTNKRFHAKQAAPSL